jgi:hypothetical protein
VRSVCKRGKGERFLKKEKRARQQDAGPDKAELLDEVGFRTHASGPSDQFAYRHGNPPFWERVAGKRHGFQVKKSGNSKKRFTQGKAWMYTTLVK